MRTTTRRLRVMAALVMAATLLPITPAVAGYDGGIRPPENRGGGGGGATGETFCDTGAARLASSGAFIYHAPASICQGVTARTDDQQVGPVWFEVFRFYGTPSDPAAAWSVSRMNMPRWADQSDRFAAFAPHPNDSGAGGSLWRSSTEAPNGGARVFRGDGWSADPGAVVRTGLVSDGQRAISTDTPFLSSQRSCRNEMTSGSKADRQLRDAFNPSHARYDDKSVKAIRTFFWEQYNSVRAEWGTAAALATLNLRGSASRGAGAHPSGPDDIVYDDGVPCSSGYDFAVSPSETPKVFTTCWIPVEMQYRIRHQGGQQFKDFRVAPGARYHTLEYPFSNDHPAQRGVIRHVVEKRFDGSNPLTAAQPFVDPNADVHPARSATQAAQAAADHANCVSGTGSVLTDAVDGSVGGPTPTSAKIEIVGGPDDYAHVGGRLDDAQFTAVYRGLYCPGGCGSGALAPKLLKLNYTLRVRGTGGYTACASTTSLACDYATDGPTSLNWRARGGRTSPPSRDVTGYFYRATDGSQRVKVEAVSTSATVRVYSRVQHSTGSCTSEVFHVFDGMGATGSGSKPCRRWTTIEHKDINVPVRVAGQRSLKVTAGVGRR